jgi:hypothetical protein
MNRVILKGDKEKNKEEEEEKKNKEKRKRQGCSNRQYVYYRVKKKIYCCEGSQTARSSFR